MDSQTIAVASLSADAPPAVNCPEMLPLDEQIVVPAVAPVADAEKSFQMASIKRHAHRVHGQ